jgi:hypothetical protein
VPYDKVWPEEFEKDYPRLESSWILEGSDRVLSELAGLKDSYPIELAEFAKELGIADEPACAWWVPLTLRRWNATFSAVKARVRRRTTSMGLKFPQVWSGPRSWTESMAILFRLMLTSWRCTILELPLRSLRMANQVHHRDGRRQVTTLSGT